VKATGTGVQEDIDFNPIISTEVGQYGGPAWNDPKLLVQGEIDDGEVLEFYVSRDGVKWYQAETVPETVEWHSGDIDRVDLTATIPVTGGGGGGGGIGGGDTTPPSISDVLLCGTLVTETTADICWVTDEPSTSQVEYWASPGMFSTFDETLVTSHNVTLTGLTPDTTYYYKTMSEDEDGNLAVSPEYTFTTLAMPPEPEPEEPEIVEPEPEEPEPEEPAPEEEPVNWPVIVGVIAGLLIVGLLIFVLVRRRAY
jgi:hypothetical protein